MAAPAKIQTKSDVLQTLEKAKKTKADVAMACGMLRFGNLTDDAKAAVQAMYPNAMNYDFRRK